MHKIYKIRAFEIVAPYTLSLKFDDDTSQVINFKNILKGKLFGELKDLDYFNQVRIDEEVKTIVWPNGADFDPATLHDWDKYEREFVLRTKNWI
jgi:hypothetical protein